MLTIILSRSHNFFFGLKSGIWDLVDVDLEEKGFLMASFILQCFSAISFAEIQLGFALIGVGFVLWSVYGHGFYYTMVQWSVSLLRLPL